MTNINKFFYRLFVACLFLQGIAQAQILGPYGTSPITFGVDANGLLSATGTYGTGTLSLSGAGTRMFWYPGKAAFRAGYVSGTDWDDANIGRYSVAFGYNTIASFEFSVAMGFSTTAAAAGATAMGEYATATGGFATALGLYTAATGNCTTAMGAYTTAAGAGATAMGEYATAAGNAATAMGMETTANSDDSFVVGTYNVGGGNATSWVATDPLFEIGNGSGSGATPRTDALVVYKNGSMAVQGPITAQSGVLTTAASVANTDIPMYTGN